MLLSAVSVLIVAQSSSEIPEGLMNNPVYTGIAQTVNWTDHRASVPDRVGLFSAPLLWPDCSAV